MAWTIATIGTVKFVVSWASAAVWAMGTVGAVAISFGLQKIFPPNLPQRSTSDFRSPIRSTVVPARWIIGKQRLAPVLVFARTRPDDDRTFDTAFAISEGDIEDVFAFWLKDKPKPEFTVEYKSDGDEYWAEYTFTGDYEDKIGATAYLRDGGSAMRGKSLRDVGSGWTEANRGNGIAWIHICQKRSLPRG